MKIKMNSNLISVSAIRNYFLSLQENLCQQLAEEDGKAQFEQDHWQRGLGSGDDNNDGERGGGCTRVLKQGAVIEQGGVNFSHVFGNSLPSSATTARPELKNCRFEALGVSLVIHPINPYVPTAHANVRFFRTIPEDKTKASKNSIWWFGGGFDLTPYYPFDEDCRHWHQTAAAACAPFGTDIYNQFKKNCDEYFYLRHRQEQRGIGGLFFDDLNQLPFETCFALTRSIGDHFIKAYRPIIAKRKSIPFSEQERSFQLYRRGRYVEFNLLYDRGTLFGLQSGGRTESILMSLPPAVQFEYVRLAKDDSREAELVSKYLKPRDWLNI